MLRKILLLLGLICILVAYFLGYWPQHQQLEQARQQNAALQQQLGHAQAVGRLAGLQNQLLDLIEQIEKQNYGQAQTLSSKFFDDVGKEIDRDKTASYVPALEAIHGRRDAITSGLAKADANTVTSVRQSLVELKQVVTGLAG